MSSGTPYIGSKISLISKAKIRYEGYLYTIDATESTVTLARVVSLGTEDRVPENPIPAREEVFEYIVFRGSDIDDLHVCEGPKRHQQQQAHDDPAIVHTGLSHSGNSSGHGMPGRSHMAQPFPPNYGAFGGMPALYGYPPFAFHSSSGIDHYSPGAGFTRDGPNVPSRTSKSPEMLQDRINLQRPPPPKQPTQQQPQRQQTQLRQQRAESTDPMNSEESPGQERKRIQDKQRGPSKDEQQERVLVDRPLDSNDSSRRGNRGEPPAKDIRKEDDSKVDDRGKVSRKEYGRDESRRGYGNEGSRRDYVKEGSRTEHEREGRGREYGKEGVAREYGREGSGRESGNEGNRKEYGREGSKRECGKEESRKEYGKEDFRRDLSGKAKERRSNSSDRKRSTSPDQRRRGIHATGSRDRDRVAQPINNLSNRSGAALSTTRSKFSEDFDFESANAKFHKEEIEHEILKVLKTSLKLRDDSDDDVIVEKEPGKASEVDNDDDECDAPNSHEKFYDRSKSFFDNISCEAMGDKKESRVITRRQERALNMDTFGTAAHYGRGQFRGRGRGAGRSSGRGWGRGRASSPHVRGRDGPRRGLGSNGAWVDYDYDYDAAGIKASSRNRVSQPSVGGT